MPCRRMAMLPMTNPSAAPASMPRSSESSGVTPHDLAAYPATYAAMPKNAACPKESSPVNPSSRLNAQANSAKHSAFIRNTG